MEHTVYNIEIVESKDKNTHISKNMSKYSEYFNWTTVQLFKKEDGTSAE